jgi:DNA-binding XRE family transcriptional regulator/desulfoferrodoxin (superoxide reductase-like protein)
MIRAGGENMDSQKIGSLLYALRKEQDLTQKKLSEKLHISDKTVSKWERGAGCPDIAMLKQLSEVFGVDVEKILLGDLSANLKDGGNMKRVKFYVCPNCGNTLTATGGDALSCCGRKLSPLQVQVSEEEHTPTVETIEDEYYITFSHDMTKQHYITFVAYVDIDRMLLMKLYPEQSGAVRFPKMHGGKLYYHCNQHGLWVRTLP